MDSVYITSQSQNTHVTKLTIYDTILKSTYTLLNSEFKTLDYCKT